MWINILSVLFSSLEAALKRRPRAIEAKIKQLSAQFKTHLAVHGDGRTMVKKMTVWETQVQLWIYSNAIFGYYFSNFCVLISFQANVPFLYQSREVKKENIGQKKIQVLKNCYMLGEWLANSIDFTSQI